MSEGVYHLPRMSMGDAMRLFGVSARSLRFYEEKGLIQAHRNRQNSRVFDGAARARLEWISRLRKAGVGLKEIRAVLDAPADCIRGTAALVLKKRRCALEDELARVDEVLESVALGTPRVAQRQRS